MKTVLFFTACFFAFAGLFAQDEKGLTPLSTATTRAVVVGISDYQSPQIPDLQFAHRDAEAFAEWLRSPAGGSVPEDRITLLTNEKATNAAIITALFGLLDVCRPGDRVIFYFSGHGDVESKTRNQPGFLLSYDTPPTVYMAGAVNLRDLQEIVSTLAEKQVKMILVTDACHAGKLAGNAINGTEATAVTLSRQFANEVKIMSCQPNEFSLEGAQWGGGRGVFSWHLLNALTGLADADADDVVSLLEAGRYLEDRVPAETAPHPQMPLVAGDRHFRLSRIDSLSLAALKETKAGELVILEKTGNKGMEEEILNRTDSLTRRRYRDFNLAMENGRLLEPKDSCADDLLALLLQNEDLQPLHGLMRRNLAVALLDEVQQTLNALLNDDPYETNNWLYNPAKYKDYPHYIDKAIELLGDNHYLRKTLRAKKLYFEAHTLMSEGTIGGLNEWFRFGPKKAAARPLLDEAIELDPEAAYLYHGIAALYKWNTPYATDSVEKYCQLAVSLSPTWLLPYLDAADEHINTTMDMDRSEKWLMLANQQKAGSYRMLDRLASFTAYVRGKMDEAIVLTQKMIDLKPDLFNGYSRMGLNFYLKKDFLNALPYLHKGLAIENIPDNMANEDLARLYQETRQFNKAEPYWRIAYQDTSISNYSIGHIFADIERFDLAEKYLIKTQNSVLGMAPIVVKAVTLAINRFLRGDTVKAREELLFALTLDPTPNAYYTVAYTWLAEIAATQNDDVAAENWFKKAVEYKCGLFIDDLPCRDIAHFRYGQFLLRRGRLEEAAQMFQWCNDWISQNGFRGYYGFALLHAKQGKTKSALDYLEKALDHWYPEPGPIFEEPLFKKIRKTKRFKALMLKHFPPGWEER